MPCKYLTVLPPVPSHGGIGNFIRVDRVEPQEDGRKASSFRTFRVTIENAVGGTFGYRVKTRKLAEQYVERVQQVKPVACVWNA